MKTLVIHPDDRSTDFLKPIYANIPDATVVTGGITLDEVDNLIRKHDRIIMLGHGSPSGLFAVGQFNNEDDYVSHVIDEITVSLLRDKTNIAIWCNADQFMNKHKLNGFYSGMFISEVSEANYCGLVGTPQTVVTQSNNAFAKWLGEVINQPLHDVFDYVKSKYTILAENNDVADYNAQRLYLRD
jgi:hypothetical protein